MNFDFFSDLTNLFTKTSNIYKSPFWEKCSLQGSFLNQVSSYKQANPRNPGSTKSDEESCHLDSSRILLPRFLLNWEDFWGFHSAPDEWGMYTWNPNDLCF